MAQKIFIAYGQPLTSQSFNEMFHHIISAGIYSGGLISTDNSSTIEINPYKVVICSPTYQSVIIKDDTITSITVENSDLGDYIVGTFTWENNADNVMVFQQKTEIDLSDIDIIFGKVIRDETDTTVITGVEYNKRSKGLYDTNGDLTIDNTLYIGQANDTGSKGTINFSPITNTLRIHNNVQITDELETNSLIVTEQIKNLSIKDLEVATQIINTTEYIISTQEQFNALIERIGTNQYKIKDTVLSLHLSCLPGGYLCYGNSSFLTEGDTWGYIETNNCLNHSMTHGTYFNCGDNNFYIKITTDNMVLKNIWIKGIGDTAAPIDSSFYLYANNVHFIQCKVSDRLSNIAMESFRESQITTHKETVLYEYCKTENIKSENEYTYVKGFPYCLHLNNCYEDNKKVIGNIQWNTPVQIGLDFEPYSETVYSAITTVTRNTIAHIDYVNDYLRVYIFNGYNWETFGDRLHINTGGYTMAITALNETDIVSVNQNTGLNVYRLTEGNWEQLNVIGLNFAELYKPKLCTLNETDFVLITGGNISSVQTFRFDGSQFSTIGNPLYFNTIDSAIARMDLCRIVLLNGTTGVLGMYEFDNTNWYMVGNPLNLSMYNNNIGNVSITPLNSTDVIICFGSCTQIARFNGSSWTLLPDTTFSVFLGNDNLITTLNETDFVICNITDHLFKVLRFGFKPA